MARHHPDAELARLLEQRHVARVLLGDADARHELAVRAQHALVLDLVLLLGAESCELHVGEAVALHEP